MTAVCNTAGYLASFWNVPYFPEWCRDSTMDSSAYNTLIRVAGSWTSFGTAFQLIMNYYGWRKVLAIGEESPGSCLYGITSLVDQLQSSEAIAVNTTVAWYHLSSEPTDNEIETVLDELRDRFRGENESVYISCK